jgi:hypothetical protein
MLMVTTTVGLEADTSQHKRVEKYEKLLTWSTGFIATPRVLGHELRLTANLCFAREASARDG